MLPDGLSAGPLDARFRPDPEGVRLGWSATAGQAFRLTGFFDERGGPVCAAGATLGNTLGSLRLPNASDVQLLSGLASGSQRSIATTTATVSAATAGRLWAVWSDHPVACG